MGRWLVFMGLVLFVSGCSTHWEHDSKRRAEFRTDDRECQMLTGTAYQSAEPGRGMSLSYEDCMWAKGWRKANMFWFFDPGPK